MRPDLLHWGQLPERECTGKAGTLKKLLKSVRSLEIGVCHFYMPKFDRMDTAEILEYLKQFRDDTIFAVAELLRRNVSVDLSCGITSDT